MKRFILEKFIGWILLVLIAGCSFTDDQKVPLDITPVELAVSNIGGETKFLVGTNGTIFVSDGNWTEPTLENIGYVFEIAQPRIGSETVVVAAEHGLFLSSNFGETWDDRTPKGLNVVTSATIKPDESAIAITGAEGSRATSVFISRNEGRDWTLAPSSSEREFVDYLEDGTLFSSDDDSVKYCECDSDQIWKIHSAHLEGGTVAAVGTDIDNATIYSGGIRGSKPLTVFESGTLQSTTSIELAGEYEGCDVRNSGYGAPRSCFNPAVINPLQASSAVAFTVDGIFLTLNSGVEWSRVALPGNNDITSGTWIGANEFVGASSDSLWQFSIDSRSWKLLRSY